jgi:hypothetical protein
MREDDDWILRAMGLDESKIREKLATDLWNEMNTFATYKAEYLELFLDGEYWGLYLLQEPMDRKTLGTSEQEQYLVQIKQWAAETDFWGDLKNNGNSELECGEFVIDKAYTENLDTVYEILEEYKNWSEGGEELGNVHLDFDLENLYTLDAFLMTIAAVDNSEKNQYLVATGTEEENTYLIRKLPWDMDASFGQMVDYLVYDTFYTLDTGDSTVEYLMTIDPELTAQGRKEVYQKLRKSVITEEYLLGHVEELYGEIQESGALMRENAAWDHQSGREQIEFIRTFIVNRLTWMDDYYAQL